MKFQRKKRDHSCVRVSRFTTGCATRVRVRVMLSAIHGIGGLGHLGVQYARRMGFETVAINRGNDKQELAQKLGAHHYIDATAGDVVAELQKLGGARVILATAPSAQAISPLVDGLSPSGLLL